MNQALETLLPLEKIKTAPGEVLSLVETHGRVILLEDNQPVYIIQKPNFFDCANGGTRETNIQSPYGKLKLHEAMRVILQDAAGLELHAAELAEEISRRKLYIKKDGLSVGAIQIRSRCAKYPALFEARSGNRIRLKQDVAEEKIVPRNINTDEKSKRRFCNMSKGGRYIDFTNYLKSQHTDGVNQLSLSFSEIDAISKNPFPPSTRQYMWGNTAKHSYSISWLKAGYIVRADLTTQRAYFTYDSARANELLSR